MSTPLRRGIGAVLTSFWFLPALMAALALAAALASVALDQNLKWHGMRQLIWVWSGGTEGARSVLSVVAASTMTVVAVVFSITISTLAKTSSHFGPRILRSFVADRGVQFTLGTFLATFVYCLQVLRTVRTVEGASFVPYVSVNIGIGLALASLVVLIYFIHHIVQMIQAEQLIASVGRDFHRLLPRGYPVQEGPATPPAAVDWEGAAVLPAAASGYLQPVDEAQLLQLATQYNLQIRLEPRAGAAVHYGEPLLRVLPALPAARQALQRCCPIGARRDSQQDPLFVLQQFVEIAGRTLGQEEPFTALDCIDELGLALYELGRRPRPSPVRRDAAGRVRLVIDAPDFGSIVASVVDPLRRAGASNPDVLVALFDLMKELAPVLATPEERTALLRQAAQLDDEATRLANVADQRRVEQSSLACRQALQLASEGGAPALLD